MQVVVVGALYNSFWLLLQTPWKFLTVLIQVQYLKGKKLHGKSLGQKKRGSKRGVPHRQVRAVDCTITIVCRGERETWGGGGGGASAGRSSILVTGVYARFFLFMFSIVTILLSCPRLLTLMFRVQQLRFFLTANLTTPAARSKKRRHRSQ
jgi:hypothetical protein